MQRQARNRINSSQDNQNEKAIVMYKIKIYFCRRVSCTTVHIFKEVLYQQGTVYLQHYYLQNYKNLKYFYT